jgi:hypothetical protein
MERLAPSHARKRDKTWLRNPSRHQGLVDHPLAGFRRDMMVASPAQPQTLGGIIRLSQWKYKENVTDISTVPSWCVVKD